ncbi:MAG: hypothetical protein HY327_05415 [Chloroflexi bacterium]|nr:hypothetical protein [Chloroflexota bacterium]
MRLLLTGFEPFGGSPINPSETRAGFVHLPAVPQPVVEKYPAIPSTGLETMRVGSVRHFWRFKLSSEC